MTKKYTAVEERVIRTIKRNPKTIKQILEEQGIEAHQKWGNWTFIESNLTLEYKGGKEHPEDQYDVDLEECRTSAEMLDYIMQIASKTWANNDMIADLIRALNACLRPQANLCSFGVSKYISLRAQPGSWKKLREKIQKRL